MGLDMYLTRKTYVKNWDHDSNKWMVTVTRNGQPTAIKTERVSYVTEEIGYWRKANQIHQWFVEHVQEGNDDCGDHYVTREQLGELLKACNAVLESSPLKKAKISNGYSYQNGKKQPILEDGEVMTNTAVAEELLPTKEGFFFGSTDYDQYYVQNLQDTKRIIEAALADDDQSGEFYYHSSW